MPKSRECDCIKIRRLFDAALDGELSGRNENKLNIHLANCEFCREEYTNRRKLKSTIQFTVPKAPSALHGAVMSRVHEVGGQSRIPVFSRKKTALISSMCVVAIGIGLLFSQAMGPLMFSNEKSEAAAPNGSDMTPPSAGYDDNVDMSGENMPGNFGTSSTDKDGVTSTPESSHKTPFIIEGTNITVLLTDKTYVSVTDHDGKVYEGSYLMTQDGLLEITLGNNIARFAIEDNLLILKEGNLFD